MAVLKLYAGAKLRKWCVRIGLTQRALADKLGVSLPFLNQMENNNRPVSTAVVLNLSQEFGFKVTELQAGDEARLATAIGQDACRSALLLPCPAHEQTGRGVIGPWALPRSPEYSEQREGADHPLWLMERIRRLNMKVSFSRVASRRRGLRLRCRTTVLHVTC